MNHLFIKEQSKKITNENRLFLLMLMLLILLIAIAGSVSFGLGFLVALILMGGLYNSLRDVILENRTLSFENTFFTFFIDIKHGLKIMFVNLLYFLMLILGLALLIVPGILVALRFSQALRIIVDNKDLDVLGAFRESEKLMNGYKKDLFKFNLSFFWHFLLGIITCGIYFIYFIPYYYVCLTNYYLHLIQAPITLVV